MQKSGYKATLYDKTKAKKSQQIQNNSDETVLSDLLLCLMSQKRILTLSSDFEMC